MDWQAKTNYRPMANMAHGLRLRVHGKPSSKISHLSGPLRYTNGPTPLYMGVAPLRAEGCMYCRHAYSVKDFMGSGGVGVEPRKGCS